VSVKNLASTLGILISCKESTYVVYCKYVGTVKANSVGRVVVIE
jgi:hypothetical protein